MKCVLNVLMIVFGFCSFSMTATVERCSFMPVVKINQNKVVQTGVGRFDQNMREECKRIEVISSASGRNRAYEELMDRVCSGCLLAISTGKNAEAEFMRVERTARLILQSIFVSESSLEVYLGVARRCVSLGAEIAESNKDHGVSIGYSVELFKNDVVNGPLMDYPWYCRNWMDDDSRDALDRQMEKIFGRIPAWPPIDRRTRMEKLLLRELQCGVFKKWDDPMKADEFGRRLMQRICSISDVATRDRIVEQYMESVKKLVPSSDRFEERLATVKIREMLTLAGTVTLISSGYDLSKVMNFLLSTEVVYRDEIALLRNNRLSPSEEKTKYLKEMQKRRASMRCLWKLCNPSASTRFLMW
jgi:hypothetical protein